MKTKNRNMSAADLRKKMKALKNDIDVLKEFGKGDQKGYIPILEARLQQTKAEYRKIKPVKRFNKQPVKRTEASVSLADRVKRIQAQKEMDDSVERLRRLEEDDREDFDDDFLPATDKRTEPLIVMNFESCGFRGCNFWGGCMKAFIGFLTMIPFLMWTSGEVQFAAALPPFLLGMILWAVFSQKGEVKREAVRVARFTSGGIFLAIALPTIAFLLVFAFLMPQVVVMLIIPISICIAILTFIIKVICFMLGVGK